MRESNFSNPLQNKACICISATMYDRRAIDCTATLPLINSLNHLAYLTSTSPRIREMVCVDGGLERLIRILRQVPRTPAQPPIRGVITKEMQAIWKWSLAFQCVVNVGVRGSENIRTRVVEAGMVPVAVRVLESFLRVADAIRDEKRREAKKEEQRARNERAAESTLRLMPDVTTPTASTLRRGAISHGESQAESMVLQPSVGGSERRGSNSNNGERRGGDSGGSNSSASSSVVPESYMATARGNAHVQSSTLPEAPTTEAIVPLVAALDSQATAGLSASSSSSSMVMNGPEGAGRDAVPHSRQSVVAAYPSGLLTNASSVEDFTASASGSDGAEDADMEGEESEMDTNSTLAQGRSREGSNADMEDTFETAEGATPRPLRRILAPIATTELPMPNQRRDAQAAWQASSAAPASVTPTREATIMATPRRPSANIADSRGRMPPPVSRDHARPAVAAAPHAPATVQQAHAAAAAAAAPRAHHHHHHHHHHHGHRERGGAAGDSSAHPSDMIYREEEVLLSLQLLAYLSKYAHVRSLFHCDLSLLHSVDTLDFSLTDAMRENVQSWNPMQPFKKNVFCIAERYTLRSSRTGLCHFAVNGESRVAPEIQYWAGVIMRNACRKDENHGGIRQCANMLCGKWERQPREFAKCRRCRKAKYCSKQCQSKGWQMGHRFWCSARSDDEHAEAKEKSREKPPTAVIVDAQGEGNHAQGTRGLPEEENMARDRDQQAQRDLTPGNLQALIDADARVERQTYMAARQQQHEQQQQEEQQQQHRQEQQEQHVAARPQTTAAGGSWTVPLAGHTHISPTALVLNGHRLPSRAAQGSSERRSSATTSAQGHTVSGGRRLVSAIPTHLQPPSSDDAGGHGFRSRTISTASSGAELSDMSDDEMERANRRVLASTVSPAQRSPGVAMTPLAAMTTAEEAMLANMTANGSGSDNLIGDFDAATTRTDLAGRPLPPPVIARHDTNQVGATGEDMLALGGRLTPAVQEEQENALFGRGDIDQMIWRGRTPAPEDHDEADGQRRRGGTITAGSANRSRLVETEDEEEEEEGVEMNAEQDGSTSLLNSALLLAGGSSSSSNHSRTMAASPRYPSSSSHALHAPVARQPHRFASVAATSSANASSSMSGMAPHAFVRGSLAGTFGDWPAVSGGSQGIHGSSSGIGSSSNSISHADGLGLDRNGVSHSTSSLLPDHPHHHHVDRLTSAPVYTTAPLVGTPRGQRPRAGASQDDFAIPSDIEDLLNTVDGNDEMMIDV